MPEMYYKDALKLGQKSRSAAKDNAGLPSLDELLEGVTVAGESDLGLVQIPAKLIVGTKTRGRVSAFAPNFMPVMEEGTEFADKWKHLCDAHLSEGIRDPIKAYEYMNRYYVEEGNKRVSVLKFFDAVNIMGTVTRILPQKDGSEAVDLYYEYVDFYHYSKVNFIEFTKKGSYLVLLKILNKEPGELWTEDDVKAFSAAYYYFRKAYHASGGAKLSSTAGDAMLSYIKIYGYDNLLTTDSAEIKKNLSRMWEEVALQEEETPIELKLEPAEEKKLGVFSKVLSQSAPTVLKVAFLYDGSPERSGWVHDHEEGRLHIQKVFEDKIETKAFNNVMEDDPIEVMEQAIREGYKLIFATSPRLLQASLRAAVEHPEIVIMNCSLNKSHRYIRTYYTRMYEAKFILGAIAGSLSMSGKLGYVCDYPIYGQIAGINAFALGAQMTNPKAEVYLEWSAIKNSEQAAQSLADQGIHFISSQETSRFLTDRRSSVGLSYVNEDRTDLLMNPVYRWGIYYEEILRRVLNKTMQAEYESSNKALNYYWGMSAGVVDIEYSDTLPLPSRRFADVLKEAITHNLCVPFITPLYTQSGELIGEEQKSLTLEQIISMDYLVENVIGTIPRYEEMTPMGKATVDMAGVVPAQTSAAQEPPAQKTETPAQSSEQAGDPS